MVAASNPMEGIELYRQHQHRIAAVILDYSMPGMNGKEAFHQLTKINRDVNVLLCSGYQMDAIALVFEKERPFDYVQKPYKPAVLLEGVQRIPTCCEGVD